MGDQQLAGIISLSELGGKHEAFVVPATTIRQYLTQALLRRLEAERDFEVRNRLSNQLWDDRQTPGDQVQAPKIIEQSIKDLTILKLVSLRHTSFLRKDVSFGDGRAYLQIEVIVVAPPAIMNKIESVTYRFADAYPTTEYVITDRHSKFKVKELANGTSIVRAEIKFSGEDALLHLNRFIDLRPDGPRI
jgi:hypothetical protein